ncbi:tail fiber protein [Escherichia coli]
MSKLLFTMTDAGRQELVNANKTGTNKVEIVSVGLGSRYYVTSTSQTNITDEIKRLTTTGGKVVSPDTIHVTAKDDSKDEYVVYTIGLYTNKGTLFAVYSQEQAIINKASSTIALISSDIAIKTLDTKNITFGDIEFINPPATETVVGVARFANEQEIDAGTDDSLAVSAKRLKQAIVKHEQSRNHPDATLTSKGFVQLSSATNSTSETLAATPKAVKAAYDLANGKYTAQDATTARKGIVQLSSATDSQREDRAATSKAVSEAMENAEGRLSKEQNGRDILDKASFVNNVGAARVYGRDIHTGAGEWTTSEFVAWLKEKGAFDQPYWMMKASLHAGFNKVITDVGPGKLNLGGCVIEVMGTYEAAIVRVTIGEYGATGFINGTVCTCTVYGDTQRFYWRVDYSTKNNPDAASTTQKGVVQLTSATDSTSETLAATAKAVKIAMDNASARLAKDRNGADIPNKPLFIQNVGLQETVNQASGALQKNQNGADIPNKDKFTQTIGACRSFHGSISTGAGNWTTAQLIEWLDSQGAFNHPYWMCKCSWSYGNNKIITDTGCGTIHLAGCVIEVMGNKGAMTIRVTTPSTSSGGGTTNAQFTYINHGADYAPGWRRDYSTKNKQPAFALGQTGSTVGNDKAVGWNSISGVYNATIGGSSTLILHFNMNAGSCPAVQFRVNYRNGGIFYRSARDGYGFEADWSEFYTTTRKPSAGDVGAYTKAEADSRYVRDIRLGGASSYKPANNGTTWTHQAPSGCAYTGIIVQDTGSNSADNIGGVYYRPIQKNINGTWYNVSSV